MLDLDRLFPDESSTPSNAGKDSVPACPGLSRQHLSYTGQATPSIHAGSGAVSRLSRIVPAENEGSASEAIETSAQGARREDVLRAAESPIMGLIRGVLDRLGIGADDAMLKRCAHLAANSPAIRSAFEHASAGLRLDLHGQPAEDVPSPALSCATCRHLDMPRQRMPDGRLQFAWRCMLGFRPLQLGHGPAYMLAPGECDRFERWEPGEPPRPKGGAKSLAFYDAGPDA